MNKGAFPVSLGNVVLRFDDNHAVAWPDDNKRIVDGVYPLDLFLTYLTDHLGFRAGLNALWMFGLPIGVAMLVNKDAVSRCLAGLALVLLSPVVMMVTAAAFGLDRRVCFRPQVAVRS